VADFAGACALAGLAAGCVAEVVQWQAWLECFFEPEQLAALGGPVAALSAIAGQGAWTVFDWTPNGAALWTIWGIEAAIVVAGTGIVAFGGVADAPFCERCDTWIDRPTTVGPFGFVHDGDRMKAAVGSSDLEPLRAMERVRPEATQYAALDLRECSGCHLLRLVTVENVVKKTGQNGKDELAETPIVQNLIVDPETWDRLAKK
jgi:hypothetical protein